MGKKKLTTNSKATEARERKAEVKATNNAAKKKAAEDAQWTDEGQDASSKRKAEAERKREAELKKRADKKKLEAEEEAKLAKEMNKGKQAKVTHTQILSLKQIREKEAEEAAAQKELRKQNLVKQIELKANTNKATEEGKEEKWASNVEDALEDMSIAQDPDKHPEKRMRAAFKEYSEVQLPIVKQENPTLKLSQQKEILWKQWQKSPENPMNG